MNHALKIDERAFSEGVKEVLYLRPIIRAAKTMVAKDRLKKPTSKAGIIAKKHR